LNIKDTYQNGKSGGEKLTETGSQEQADLPNKEVETYQIRKSGTSELALSKEILNKDIYTDNNISDNNTSPDKLICGCYSVQTALEIIEGHRGKPNRIVANRIRDELTARGLPFTEKTWDDHPPDTG
jgi:hypothetical protein